VQTWRLHAFELEPLSADFPYARSLLVVRSERTIKKTGQKSAWFIVKKVTGSLKTSIPNTSVMITAIVPVSVRATPRPNR
jgi:hypothetical protein